MNLIAKLVTCQKFQCVKVSKYGVISGQNTEKYGLQITRYSDTPFSCSVFHNFRKNLHHRYLTGSYNTAQKMKFSIKDFFSKCDQIRSFLNGKIHFLCSAKSVSAYPQYPPPKLLQLFSNYKGIIYDQTEFIIFIQK